jgi:uncharacterized protein (UPF0548 family)
LPAEFTYAEVGATRDVDGHPEDAFTLVERAELGDETVFEPATAFVLGFGMQRAVGFEVDSDDPVAREGAVVTLRARFGPLRIVAPTRVVYVIDEPDRGGFAYGTLPGHPESGEEVFLVERRDGSTSVEVRAFSRPGRWFTRVGAPVARRLQRRAARQYVDSVRRAVADV